MCRWPSRPRRLSRSKNQSRPNQVNATPDRSYREKVLAARATPGHLGKEMMERWNWFERNNPLFHELAVMGHQEGATYQFIIASNGKTFGFTVRELPAIGA